MIYKYLESPSSRRAWIEMDPSSLPSALPWSPSSRRAWIEIEVRNRSCASGAGRPPRGGRG